jgi:hypothetical protein
MNTPYPRDIDLGAIADVLAEGHPPLRDPAIRREVVRGADALLREFEAEMAADAGLKQTKFATYRSRVMKKLRVLP